MVFKLSFTSMDEEQISQGIRRTYRIIIWICALMVIAAILAIFIFVEEP